LSAPTNTAAATTATSINPLTLPPPPYQHCHCRQWLTTAIAAFTIEDNTSHIATATAMLLSDNQLLRAIPWTLPPTPF
jgi:hypothetical protein